MVHRLRPYAALAVSFLTVNTGAKNNPKTKYVAGKPVYNFDLASRDDWDESVWILKLPDKGTDKQVDAICKEVGAKCTFEGHPSKKGVPFVTFKGTQDELEDILKAHPEVESVEPDMEVHVIPELLEVQSASCAEIESRALPWGLDRIDDQTGLDQSYDGTSANGVGVHVYVLDTGINIDHQDFEGRASLAIDMTNHVVTDCSLNPSECGTDVHGHGTHCAGTVAGATFGVAKGVSVYSAKVLNDTGFGWTSWTTGALDWIASSGQRPAIASMSLGGSGQSQSELIAINSATTAGVTVVVAAGNENSDACGFSPAYVPNAITVASTDCADARSSFSNYGTCVDIHAPGSGVRSAAHDSNTAVTTLSGTSMACPHVSGAAAILLGNQPSLTAAQVTSTLLGDAGSNLVSDVQGSPNKILYVGTLLFPPTASPTASPTAERSPCASFTTSSSCPFNYCRWTGSTCQALTTAPTVAPTAAPTLPTAAPTLPTPAPTAPTPAPAVETTLDSNVNAGDTTIQLADVTGCEIGMALTLDDGVNTETKIIISVTVGSGPRVLSGRRLAAGSVTLDSALTFSFSAGVSVSAVTVVAAVGSDPITWRGDQKVKFWLSSTSSTEVLTTPSLRIFASTLEGPSEDLQWIGTYTVTTADGAPLVQVSAKHLETLTLPATDVFEQLDVVVGGERSPRMAFRQEGFDVHRGTFQIVIGRRDHYPPRTHGSSFFEYVQVQDRYVSFALMASHAGNEFPHDYEKQRQYTHMDMLIMDTHNGSAFKGVFPELWGWAHMSKETEDMLIAPSMRQPSLEGFPCLVPPAPDNHKPSHLRRDVCSRSFMRSP